MVKSSLLQPMNRVRLPLGTSSVRASYPRLWAANHGNGSWTAARKYSRITFGADLPCIMGRTAAMTGMAGNKNIMSRNHAIHSLEVARPCTTTPDYKGAKTEGSGADVKHNSALESVTWDQSDRHVTVYWRHLEAPCHFPVVWLRDCCQCEKCVMDVGARTQLLADLDLNISPADVKHSSEEIRITWKDDHVSTYPAGWLLNMRFPSSESDVSHSHLGPAKKHWNAESISNPPTFNFHDVLDNESVQFKWIDNLEVHGFCLLEDAPQESKATYKLSNAIAYPKNTPYGTHFELESKAGNDAKDIGYTNTTLELHTDQPMWRYIPGVLLLHSIRQTQTEGGVNELSDGFKAAVQLREETPDYFEVLTKPVVHYWMQSHGAFHYNMMQCNPIIRLDRFGEPCQVVFSNHFRNPLLHLPSHQVDTFYSAIKAFQEILYRPENLLRIRLKDGDIACIDNHRVLHGRTGWNAASGHRHLVTMYIDWDEMMSRRRVLTLGKGRM